MVVLGVEEVVEEVRLAGEQLCVTLTERENGD